MTVAFIHPSHPSAAVKTPASLERSSSRDIHALPDFNSITPQSKPVFYLPPLLSALPEHLVSQATPETHEYPPLSTETRLPDIDLASLSLHHALHHFKPTTPKYASTPYAEAFNWSELRLPIEEEREWYCVVFRSKRKSGSDGICKSPYHFMFPVTVILIYTP